MADFVSRMNRTKPGATPTTTTSEFYPNFQAPSDHFLEILQGRLPQALNSSGYLDRPNYGLASFQATSTVIPIESKAIMVKNESKLIPGIGIQSYHVHRGQEALSESSSLPTRSLIERDNSPSLPNGSAYLPLSRLPYEKTNFSTKQIVDNTLSLSNRLPSTAMECTPQMDAGNYVVDFGGDIVPRDLTGKGRETMYAFPHDNPVMKQEILTYRALYQAQLCGIERSSHRNHFQRENHILAERQRREEMNEKFAILKSMLPRTNKRDKASIVGDTINFILELERTLKQLQAQKTRNKGSRSFLKMNRAPSKDSEKSGSGEKDRSIGSSIPSTESGKVVEESVTSSSRQRGNEAVEAIDTATDVEVQDLGSQAVIKVLCRRRPGLVLRVLAALEECKVDILQSNVATVGEKTVHFITVEMNPGVSASVKELIAVLRSVTNPD